MHFGSQNYQIQDSYFVVIHPFTYVFIGLLVILSAAIFITVKKRKKQQSS